MVSKNRDNSTHRSRKSLERMASKLVTDKLCMMLMRVYTWKGHSLHPSSEVQALAIISWAGDLREISVSTIQAACSTP